jgi:hypothetical protein
MSRGLTIAEFVQQVIYAIYKTRLDTSYSQDGPASYHADTDKFKEIVMEGNFVLQELQKEQDWNWLRRRWTVGTSEVLCPARIQEFALPADAYKVCTGFDDAVRLHRPHNWATVMEIPFTSPRSGMTTPVAMFDQYARANVPDTRIRAFVVGETLTFTRPFVTGETGLTIETDIIRLLDPLHICDSTCTQPCPSAYEDKVFLEVPDPYYLVVKTAARRAEGDPGTTDRVMSLTDEASKLLSAMRENDSSKTVPDSYRTIELGYVRVL